MTRLAFRLPPELASEILRALLSELERRALAPWDSLCGDGPELEAEAGEEHAAMVDLHSADIWPHSGDGRKGWCA